MDSRRITRVIALLVLALLAGSPGALLAACEDCHPCCRPSAVPMVGAPSCCPTMQAAAPEEALPATVPPTPPVLMATAAVELPAEEMVAELAPEPLPNPPPLHQGLGLYTLHATFLI
jgi:hypothetical protein